MAEFGEFNFQTVMLFAALYWCWLAEQRIKRLAALHDQLYQKLQDAHLI